jgi:hypothetical protein
VWPAGQFVGSVSALRQELRTVQFG